jgi:hypothetical protein
MSVLTSDEREPGSPRTHKLRSCDGAAAAGIAGGAGSRRGVERQREIVAARPFTKAKGRFSHLPDLGMSRRGPNGV